MSERFTPSVCCEASACRMPLIKVVTTLIFVVGGFVQLFSEVLCDLVVRMNSAVIFWLTEAAERSEGASFLFPPVAFVQQGCELKLVTFGT